MTDAIDALEEDAATQGSAGVEAGRSVRPCDSSITAIYPVRYGYANLFDKIAAPATPPPLSTLLSATSIAAGKGYVARLLRPGWIYIREEAGGSAMQIFKYERKSPDGVTVIEAFSKYLFSGSNALRGLTLDRSSGRQFYPFVFVSKGVSVISILYTEHELPPGVIDKINGDAAFRAKTMQKINIASGGRDAIEATPENFGRLIEDYRARRDRVLDEVAGIGLDLLTTQASFDIEPDNVAQQIRNTECYGESSMIVALHDPLGRQFEIAQGHAKLAVWEQDHAALNLYPYMIGQFVEAARTSKTPEMVKAVAENINLAEHQKFWREMDDQFQAFKDRRKEIATLYRAFMYPGEKTDEVGSLDRYFRYFFDYDNPNQTQLRQLLEVAAPIFDGLMASQQGQDMLTALADNAHGPEADKQPWEQRNAYGAIIKGMIALSTQPQNSVDWANTTAVAMDRLLNGLGAFWGRAAAEAIFAAGKANRGGLRLSAGALNHMVSKVIPKVLDIFGLRIKPDGTVTYSTAELGKVIGRAMQKSFSANDPYAGIRFLEAKQRQLKVGQRAFNWGQTQKQERLPELWRLAEIEVTRVSASRFQFVVGKSATQRIGIMVDGSFSGMSAFFNMMAITSLTSQSQFSNANPLVRGSMMHDALSLGAAVSALTVDMMVVSRIGLQISGKAAGVLPAAAAARLAPAIQGSAARVARVLAGTLPTKLIAVANFAGAASSTWSSLNEFQQGNAGAGYGHALVALGSGILFFQAAASLAGVGAGASATGIGLPVGIIVAVLALVLVGVGTVMTLIYSKDPFEQLLFQCFWGKSRNYAFWQDSQRDLYVDRLARAQMVSTGASRNTPAGSELEATQIAFRMEVQEFMNIYSMPQMTIDRSGGDWRRKAFGNAWFEDRSYDIELTLPQFVLGQSDIVAAVYTADDMFGPSGEIIQSVDAAATRKFTDAVASALAAGRYIMADGVMKLSVRIDFGQRANIIWYYEPKPDIIVPMRILTPSGQLQLSGLTAGMLNEEPI